MRISECVASAPWLINEVQRCLEAGNHADCVSLVGWGCWAPGRQEIPLTHIQSIPRIKRGETVCTSRSRNSREKCAHQPSGVMERQVNYSTDVIKCIHIYFFALKINFINNRILLKVIFLVARVSKFFSFDFIPALSLTNLQILI